MRVLCIGGGPAGLYLALLLKKADPRHDIRVVERNRPYDTFGWGVVFSDQTLGNLARPTRKRAREIADAFNHWDDIDVHFKGRTITSGGHGFCGIGRKRLLNILQARCEALGVELVFENDVSTTSPRRAAFDADLVDRLRRRQQPHPRRATPRRFQPDIDLRRCRFVWLGTQQAVRRVHVRVRGDAARLVPGARLSVRRRHVDVHRRDPGGDLARGRPRPDDAGGRHRVLRAPVRARTSTATAADAMPAPARLGDLDPLPARRLPRLGALDRCATARSVPIVLMGDAAHTAHFSVGSGTKLALEDAIALAARIAEHDRPAPAALGRYEAERSVEVLKIQNAARNSTEWFENVERYTRARGRAVRLQPADAQPAHLARESAPARRGLRRRGRALVRARSAACRRRAACRRCSRRSRCAG